MKRVGNLYDRAFTPDALLAAFHDAARHKRRKRACFNFEKRLTANLADLHRELHDGSYRPRPYFEFEVDTPKPRRIFAPAFRDCVVQHAIYNMALPIFDASFIDQSFACRIGRGTHAAADYAQQALQHSRLGSYVLKLDIRRFFYRIDRAVLRRQFERKVKDSRFVDLMMQFADYGEPVGIPIGNLLSQLYALIYLDPVDHYIKRDLGARRYCRYVDDLALFDLDREQGVEMQRQIEAFLRATLRLELSRWSLTPTRRGINFVGYRTWARARFVRRRSLRNFRRALRHDKHESLISILGHARRTHTLQHLLRTLKDHPNGKNLRLPQSFQRAHHHPGQPARRQHRAGNA